jgi:uncharacterized protein
MIKVILDTNIFISAYVFDKKILNLLDYCFENYEHYTSLVILEEIKDVLTRDKTVKMIKNYNPVYTNQFINKILEDSVILEPNEKVNICRDPKDNMFLELANVCKIDYLISGDKDLLALKEFKWLKILNPSQFIEELKIEI